MLTLRLDSHTENEIEQIAKSEGISKSELIRKSIHQFIKKYRKPSFYDVSTEKSEYSLGNKNFSVESEKMLRNKFKKSKKSL